MKCICTENLCVCCFHTYTHSMVTIFRTHTISTHATVTSVRICTNSTFTLLPLVTHVSTPHTILLSHIHKHPTVNHNYLSYSHFYFKHPPHANPHLLKNLAFTWTLAIQRWESTCTNKIRNAILKQYNRYPQQLFCNSVLIVGKFFFLLLPPQKREKFRVWRADTK